MRVQTGETDRITLLAVDSTGTGVSGATINLSLRRASDSMYFTGTAFTTTYTTVAMSETDSSNLPGVYHYDFLAPEPEAKYAVTATTASASIVNGPWFDEIIVGYWVDNLDEAMSSRASDANMSEALKRIGSSIIDMDLKKITGIVDRCLSYLKRL